MPAEARELRGALLSLATDLLPSLEAEAAAPVDGQVSKCLK